MDIAKYRAKRIDTGETVEGQLVYADDGSDQGIPYIASGDMVMGGNGDYAFEAYEVDPSTIERVEDGCKYCGANGAAYNIKIKPCANGDFGLSAGMIDGGLVIFQGCCGAMGYIELHNCPFCGKPLNP